MIYRQPNEHYEDVFDEWVSEGVAKRDNEK
jgi:hypothetical protein